MTKTTTRQEFDIDGDVILCTYDADGKCIRCEWMTGRDKGLVQTA